jgi:hypothetical protein
MIRKGILVLLLCGGLFFINRGSVFAQDFDLDHYKCYEVEEGKSVKKGVLLEDQFHTEEVRVLRPKLFCNPVIKNKEERHPDPYTHLVCYKIIPRTQSPVNKVIAYNQFGEQPLVLSESKLLCVPSTKTPFNKCVSCHEPTK